MSCGGKSLQILAATQTKVMTPMQRTGELLLSQSRALLSCCCGEWMFCTVNAAYLKASSSDAGIRTASSNDICRYGNDYPEGEESAGSERSEAGTDGQYSSDD